MLAITLSDLRYRRRQFLIAVVGAGLTFALALLLSGLVAGFHNEVRRTVGVLGADSWIVGANTSGTFTSVAALPPSSLGVVRKTPGVRQADPVAIALQTARTAKAHLRTMVIGAAPGTLGQIRSARGRVEADGQAVVDARLHVRVGEQFNINGRTFTVVGVVHGLTVLGGTPDVWITLHDAQAMLFGGANLITAIVAKGQPAQLPATLRSMTPAEVRTDSAAPMAPAIASVDHTKQFMWIVAAVIIAALVYVSALQRLRDFAVMKAVGASSATLFGGVTLQSVIVTSVAGLLAASTADLLKPMYNVPVEVPHSAYLSLPVVAITVGVLSALVALRQAVNVDPAIAFGASA